MLSTILGFVFLFMLTAGVSLVLFHANFHAVFSAHEVFRVLPNMKAKSRKLGVIRTPYLESVSESYPWNMRSALGTYATKNCKTIKANGFWSNDRKLKYGFESLSKFSFYRKPARVTRKLSAIQPRTIALKSVV